MTIALLDDELNTMYLQRPDLIACYMIDGNTVKRISAMNSFTSISHGTVCATVLEKHLCGEKFTYIQVMNSESDNGNIRDLRTALEFCLKIKVDIISLSIGSTRLSDYFILRPIIKKLGENKTLIFAAQCNDGYLTMPAVYEEVFGVIADIDLEGVLSFSPNVYGINLVGELPALDTLPYSYKYRGNSYAVPEVVGYLAGQIRCGKIRKDIILQQIPLVSMEYQHRKIESMQNKKGLEDMKAPCVYISQDIIQCADQVGKLMTCLYRKFALEVVCLTKAKKNEDIRFQVFTKNKDDDEIEVAAASDIILIWNVDRLEVQGKTELEIVSVNEQAIIVCNTSEIHVLDKVDIEMLAEWIVNDLS